MFVAKCHCGKVSLEAKLVPETVTSCNCSICYRIGAIWAYYFKEQVKVVGAEMTNTYLWGDKTRTYHSCSVCHCVTHYTQIRDDGIRVAINSRMVAPGQTHGIKVREFDGAGTFEYIKKSDT